MHSDTIRRVHQVIFIVIDGCRPDALQQAETPTLDMLMRHGSFSMEMQTVIPPITLPAHFSIFSGRSPIGHNVLTNTGSPDTAPEINTILELAKYNGLSTAAFYSWEQLRNLAPPGVLDQAFHINTLILDKEIRDRTIAEVAAQRITATEPDLSFVYFEGVDIAGHDYGWMSEEYVEAINRTDKAIALLLARLSPKQREKYTIVVISDHGGIGTHHKKDVPEVMTVPWIVAGPAAKHNYRIKSELSVLDAAPTIAALLGIAPHWEWEGKVIKELLVNA